MGLSFGHSPKGLIAIIFIDYLFPLPNLGALQVFSTTNHSAVPRGLRRGCARFPSTRELGIRNTTAEFVGSSPNVESVILTDASLSSDSVVILESHRKELEKLAHCRSRLALSATGVRNPHPLMVHHGNRTGFPACPM